MILIVRPPLMRKGVSFYPFPSSMECFLFRRLFLFPDLWFPCISLLGSVHVSFPGPAPPFGSKILSPVFATQHIVIVPACVEVFQVEVVFFRDKVFPLYVPCQSPMVRWIQAACGAVVMWEVRQIFHNVNLFHIIYRLYLKRLRNINLLLLYDFLHSLKLIFNLLQRS